MMLDAVTHSVYPAGTPEELKNRPAILLSETSFPRTSKAAKFHMLECGQIDANSNAIDLIATVAAHPKG